MLSVDLRSWKDRKILHFDFAPVAGSRQRSYLGNGADASFLPKWHGRLGFAVSRHLAKNARNIEDTLH